LVWPLRKGSGFFILYPRCADANPSNTCNKCHIQGLVHFRVIDVGEASEPFRVSSASLPNFDPRSLADRLIIYQCYVRAQEALKRKSSFFSPIMMGSSSLTEIYA
jgi:hypothetical protein